MKSTDIKFSDSALTSSKSDEWSTPDDLYQLLNDEFHFTLDPAATKENTKCKKFYTKEDDGLKQDWFGETVFLNCPYSEIKEWTAKSELEGCKHGTTVVMLIPARTDTKYWHKYVKYASEIRFLKGRLKFGDSKNSAPFPSAVVVFKATSELQKVKFWDYKQDIKAKIDFKDTYKGEF